MASDLFLDEFSRLLQGLPDRVAGFGIQALHLSEQAGDGGAVGVALMGAQFGHGPVAGHLSIATDVCLVNEAQRTDDAQRHLAHFEACGHCAEASLKCQVHQGRVDEVVAMVPKGYLVAAQLLRKIEQLLAAVPRAEEARRLTLRLLKAGGNHVQRHLQIIAELLKVVSRSLVADILHPHMNRLDTKSGMMNLCPAAQQFRKKQGVLAA